MIGSSQQLVDWVIEQQLPWLRYNSEAGELEFIIDNYLASAYRSCPAYFFELALKGLHKKASGGSPERSWPLDFGILFHKMMEVYYKNFKSPDFELQKFAIDAANHYWNEMKMNVHLQHKECQQLGGIYGFAGMLIQYATQFKAENEHIRVLASEVSFGKNREVLLGEFYFLSLNVSVYLSGRIDILADDGHFISPLDHKTMGAFRGDPLSRFHIDEGPTGYIYAMNKVLPTIVPEELILKRNCHRILMNLISKAVPKNDSRFKRFPIYKSDDQLKSYEQRMLLTCEHILKDLYALLDGMDVPRDTSKCNNWYFRQCTYYDIHRQADKDAEAATIRNGYIKLPIWDTQAVEPIEDTEY